MALCPFARIRLLPENYTQPKTSGQKRLLIFHQAVSWAESLFDFFNSPGVVVESTFYLYRTGELDQYLDTDVQADANVQANGIAISVETWDAGGDINGEWTPEQLATLKRLAAWCIETHPQIQPQAAATPFGSGLGGHNWFPTEWAGGPRACPGPNRSQQIRNIIIPYVANGGGWREEDDLAGEGPKILEAITDLRNDMSTRWFNSGKTDSAGRVIDRLGGLYASRLDNDWIRKQPGGIAPGDLVNATASVYRYVFEQLDKKLNAIASAIAQQAEDDTNNVALTPEQLADLKSDTGATIREQMELAQAQMEQQFGELVELVTQRFDLDRADVLSALSEFYGRAVAAETNEETV